MNKRKVAILLGAAVVALGVATYWLLSPGRLDPVTSLSVSTDGRYVVSAHENSRLVLWDVEAQRRAVLSEAANLYSAYFIPESDVFLWQDLDNIVRVQHVDGEVIEAFEHFPTYGHVMSEDMQHYLSSNQTWNIYHGHGETLRPVLLDSRSPSFMGTGQVLNLSIGGRYFVSGGSGSPGGTIEDSPPVREEEFRFSSSYGGVTLWDLDSLAPVAKLPGNSSKTYATISPDGQWVVSGDENTIGLFWNTDAPEVRHRMADYDGGIYLDDTPFEEGDSRNWDKSQLIPVPESTQPDDWGNLRSLATPTTIALAFINGSEEFLRIGYSHYTRDKGMNRTYAALFEAGNPWPQAYLDLGIDPYPSINNYSRNLSIDSSPDANLLVTGHAFDGGITVYRYDPDARTLSKEWVGK